MMTLFHKTPRIFGIEVPRRRFTRWALVYFVVFICVPILGIAAILDYFFVF